MSEFVDKGIESRSHVKSFDNPKLSTDKSIRNYENVQYDTRIFEAGYETLYDMDNEWVSSFKRSQS